MDIFSKLLYLLNLFEYTLYSLKSSLSVYIMLVFDSRQSHFDLTHRKIPNFVITEQVGSYLNELNLLLKCETIFTAQSSNEV